MVSLIMVQCTKCRIRVLRPNYHNKGREKKPENKPRVDSKCYCCGGAVKRIGF